MPATKVSWLICVITLASRGGVLWVTGATPTETALFTWASWAGYRPMAAELAAKPMTPVRNTFLWPNRSPILPMVISVTARASR